MYSIKQATQKTGLSAPTLRYYEKENLLPSIPRDENGLRIYNDIHIKSIYFIKALRATDMPIREIKEYVSLYEGGDKTVQLRKQLLERHKTKVEENLKSQAGYLERINEKLRLYEESVRSSERCEK